MYKYYFFTLLVNMKCLYFSSLFNDRDSEDESSPFSTLHRHGSFGKDSDTEDPKRDAFHMLRSTRPKKATLEHNDSLSSGEEDDDEGFEILTAENLFSTLLSRVRMQVGSGISLVSGMAKVEL